MPYTSPNALIVFMKAPRLGTVKTRLQPHLTQKQSQQLYMAMGSDIVNLFRDAKNFDLHIHFAPADAQTEMENWLGDDLVFTPQITGDLGGKMATSLELLLSGGYQKVALIGSDLPFISVRHIEKAFAELENNEAVFGPTDDGGYYLVGLRSPQPMLFKNIEWSTEEVLAQTKAIAKNAQINLGFISPETDLDTIVEVRQLWQSLKKSASLQKHIPQTFQILKSLKL